MAALNPIPNLGVDEKTALSDADLMLIEDSDASNEQKYVQVSNLFTRSSFEATALSNPYFQAEDTTNNVQARLSANDTVGIIGTVSSGHGLALLANNLPALTINEHRESDFANNVTINGDLSVTGTLPSHNHAAGDINSGTFADARVAESNITQHESALTFTGISETPANFTSAAGKVLKVNSGASAVEYSDITIDSNGLKLEASDYLNWGATGGSSGYGIRDNAGTIEIKDSGGSWAAPGGGGSTTFVGLTDTPANFTSAAGKITKVNSGATALEFSDITIDTNGLKLEASDYLNWGATGGSSGYGIRDSSGTMQFKDSGGSWAAFGSGTFLGLSDTQGSFTDNELLVQTGSAVESASGLSWDDTSLILSTSDAGTSNDVKGFEISRDSTGTVADGFGVYENVQLEDDGGTSQDVGRILWEWEDVSADQSECIISIRDTTLTEHLSINIDGIMVPNAHYMNFGTTHGESGFGFRDNDGTMQVKSDGGSWEDIDSTASADPGSNGRAVQDLYSASQIQYITIATTGNGTDAGDMNSSGSSYHTQASNGKSERTVTHAGGITNTLEYKVINTVSDSLDHGDRTESRNGVGGNSNRTNDRGCHFMGQSGYSDVIDYITVSTTGNSTDFGDLTDARAYSGGFDNGSNERGVACGGFDGGDLNVCDYWTINSIGNATDYGDLSYAGYGGGGGSTFENERGFFWCRTTSTSQIDYWTVSSTGNGADFGDRTVNLDYGGGEESDLTYMVFMSGYNNTTMDYVTAATTANALDFGDCLSSSVFWSNGGASN